PGRHRPGVAAPRVISSISSKSSSPADSGPMGTPMELNRVLIVDDDPAIRRVVSALLDLDEYGLLEAAAGHAALEGVTGARPRARPAPGGWSSRGPPSPTPGRPPAMPGPTPTRSSRSRPWPCSTPSSGSRTAEPMDPGASNTEAVEA